MDSLIRLLAAHKPIGIYNIVPESNIYKELYAYASELERLEEELARAEKESFVPLSEDEGLSSLERIWGAVRDDLEADQRRSMITSRFALKNNDFTVKSLEKILSVAGVSGRVTEYPRQFRVTVDIDGEHSLAERRWIRSVLEGLFPAHLETDPVFEGFCFEDIDESGKTFAQMEARGMTWKQIDIYCVE